MHIDPHNATFSDTYPLDFNQEIEDAKKKFEELISKDEITAIGPEDHLRALQQDLLKAGYRKLK